MGELALQVFHGTKQVILTRRLRLTPRILFPPLAVAQFVDHLELGLIFDYWNDAYHPPPISSMSLKELINHTKGSKHVIVFGFEHFNETFPQPATTEILNAIGGKHYATGEEGAIQVKRVGRDCEASDTVKYLINSGGGKLQRGGNLKLNTSNITQSQPMHLIIQYAFQSQPYQPSSENARSRSASSLAGFGAFPGTNMTTLAKQTTALSYLQDDYLQFSTHSCCSTRISQLGSKFKSYPQFVGLLAWTAQAFEVRPRLWLNVLKSKRMTYWLCLDVAEKISFVKLIDFVAPISLARRQGLEGVLEFSATLGIPNTGLVNGCRGQAKPLKPIINSGYESSTF
ncbi:uncharacterized protein BDR25DRAFT_349040 [Lindgomyces ingoldianus]|uniref:Uncharacterized protein n=1 Tax=Lindgomyces ingoldianus TaxID=673940 RepID=A0ACB6RDD3_9PLEO|nr:uncharacterized protein BDR25DRAFT_349040 [Lindgomyces ingoldianus]KAF2477146.1 hypothetical protein BDR25DRAFT_349040 [Lindgomyces ingoldianus]